MDKTHLGKILTSAHNHEFSLEKEREFENIVREYGGLITKICFYFSIDSEDFKDLRQEVMYHIWKGLDKFRNESKISTWIYRISFNSCISFQRKDKKFKKISTENILNLPAEDENFRSKLEEYEKMHALIQKLKYEERVIILMWLDDLSYDEIAHITGHNRNTVATKLKRIKEKLIKMNS